MSSLSFSRSHAMQLPRDRGSDDGLPEGETAVSGRHVTVQMHGEARRKLRCQALGEPRILEAPTGEHDWQRPACPGRGAHDVGRRRRQRVVKASRNHSGWHGTAAGRARSREPADADRPSTVTAADRSRTRIVPRQPGPPRRSTRARSALHTPTRGGRAPAIRYRRNTVRRRAPAGRGRAPRASGGSTVRSREGIRENRRRSSSGAFPSNASSTSARAMRQGCRMAASPPAS